MQKVSDTLEEQKGKVEKLEIGIAGAKVVINRVGKTAAKHEKKIKKNTEKLKVVEKRVDVVEEDLEETKEKVEEIDKKVCNDLHVCV